FATPLAAGGAPFGDFDNDGCVDIAINVNEAGPLLLRNACGSLNHNWILIRLGGSKSNRDGIGARIKVTGASGRAQYGLVSTAGSYLSASDVRVHFGLGAAERIRELRVEWPSGIVQRVQHP